MTLNDLKRQNKGFNGFFCRLSAATQVYIIHKVAPRYWCWWRGVVGNAFRLKQSYSTPTQISLLKFLVLFGILTPFYFIFKSYFELYFMFNFSSVILNFCLL